MYGIKEKKERSLGVHLHMKAERCLGPKCAGVRRPTRPGVHGRKRQRRNISEFSRQLREKQKFKITYGVNENNLRTMYEKASKTVGDIEAKFMELFERRLDNVVFRLGIGGSRSMARKMILQGHISVNGRKVTSPGYQVRANDIVAVREQSRGKGTFKETKDAMKRAEVPSWLQADSDKMEGKVLEIPRGTEPPFEINLLVESFSK